MTAVPSAPITPDVGLPAVLGGLVNWLPGVRWTNPQRPARPRWVNARPTRQAP
jgi:hypothetical protein